jgi:hypothetical protein
MTHVSRSRCFMDDRPLPAGLREDALGDRIDRDATAVT